MSAETNKALVLRYLEALSGNDKPAELVERFVADPSLRDHIAVNEAAFPRYVMEPQDVIAEGDRVVVRFEARVRHEGEFMGMPPTGSEASFEGIVIYRIQGGKIVDHWLQLDAPSLLQQLAPSGVGAASD